MPAFLLAQEEEPKNWQLTGYVKYLPSYFVFHESWPVATPPTVQFVDTFLQDNLVHNRLNFRWYINPQFTFRTDLRTRLFFGQLVSATPGYGKLVDNANNDYFDLSILLLNKRGVVLHSMIDRLYLQWVKGDWEITAGRQRINWGISTVWNPNDIWNAFDFTDFDYEERPGSDALLARYYTGFASSVELAIRVFDDWDEATIAGRWKFNKWQYDFQLIGGYAQTFAVAGLGWAGNLGNAGFKGETTYFWPTRRDDTQSFAFTTSVDYAFRNSFYINLGYLYNSEGSTDANAAELFTFQLNARNLYPYRHSIFFQWTYPLTPLLNGGMAIIYSPVQVHAMFFNPTMSYSIATGWDLDLVGQLTFNNNEDAYVSPVQAVFLRLKWSFGS